MRTRQKWMGIIVVLAVLLLASTGLGHARGGGHGISEVMGSAKVGSGDMNSEVMGSATMGSGDMDSEVMGSATMGSGDMGSAKYGFGGR